MKKKSIGLIAIFCVSVFFLGSCKKKGCMDENATNYDSEVKKDDGSCVFPDPDPRDSFLGSYFVTDSIFYSSVFDHAIIYTLIVTTGETSQDTLYLNNWGGYGYNYLALVSGSNFSVSSNSFPGNITGSGSFGTDEINFISGDGGGFSTKAYGTK